MTRRPSSFKQRDVTAAIKAAVAGGLEIGRVEIGPDGRIILTIGKEPAQAVSAPLDDWMAKHAS